MARLLSDRYLLGPRIGAGGMGAVYEADDQTLQRTVAVKLVPASHADDRRFLREARALSRLQHPGIVQLFDAGTDGGDAYLVLELVRGRSLADLLGDGPLAVADVRRIGGQLAEALAHAHALGVVHRDVSTANILIDHDGGARLTDFGIARTAEATMTVGDVWGTPAFVAPEQIAGGPVGPPADVYALGLVLLEALTGERAFPGTARESGLARLHRDPAVPGHLAEPWPDLLRAMTARAPQERPTANVVAAHLGTPLGTPRTMPLPVTPPPAPVATLPLTEGAPRSRAPSVQSRRAAVPVPWWRGPVGAFSALLLVSALLLGLSLRAERRAGAGGVISATTPAAGLPTVSPPPPSAPADLPEDGPGDGPVDAKQRVKGKGKRK